MIYFIFDDVDLVPEKIEEILSVIIKYFSHPNLIVITTAEEKQFLDVLENNIDKRMGKLPTEWREFLSTHTLVDDDIWPLFIRKRERGKDCYIRLNIILQKYIDEALKKVNS